MMPMPETIEDFPDVPVRADDPPEVLVAFTGPERILGILPFVADVSSTPRWHHLLFTEDKVLAVPAFPDPAPGAEALFLPRPTPGAAPYPSVHASLGLVAIPRPLTPAHVTMVVPYAAVRRVRLVRGRGPQTLPELEIRAAHRTSWWLLEKGDAKGDSEKACYDRDLLLALLPFPIELVGFSETPRPSDRRIRRGVREPLPILARTDGSLRPRRARRSPRRDGSRSSIHGPCRAPRRP